MKNVCYTVLFLIMSMFVPQTSLADDGPFTILPIIAPDETDEVYVAANTIEKRQTIVFMMVG